VNYEIQKASPLLQPFVKQYWTMEACMNEKEHVQRIIPSALVELNFFFADRPKAENSKNDYPSSSVLTGQQSSFFDIIVSGNLDMFSVSFQPGGAHCFFNIQTDEILDQKVALQDLDPKNCERIEEELFSASSFKQRISIFEKYLISKLSNWDPLLFERIKASISGINEQVDNIGLKQLASEAYLSTKQFERVFNRLIGISPKKFQRIIRFQRLLHLKQLQPELSLTSLAYTSGYYDQAHMIHEFKKLTGMTPKELLESEEGVISDYFS